jgi:hypothetical protein
MELIDKIMSTVYDNGGRWSLASIIAEENPMIFSVPERRYFKNRSIHTSQVAKVWKEEDLQYIKHNYYRIPLGKMAIKLGRTKNSIQNIFYKRFRNEKKENSY